jgi:hypothetical protein
MLNQDIIKFVQRDLKRRNFYKGSDDGDFGTKSQAALQLETRIPPAGKSNWNLDQKLVGYIQIRCYDCHINPKGVDGSWGDNTQKAYEQLKLTLEPPTSTPVWRPGEVIPTNPNNWPVETMEALNAFYGKIGDQSQLGMVNLPYPMKLAWKKSTILNKFMCNKKVADSISRVLTKVLAHYGQAKITELGLDIWGGCHNIRLMRGGTRASTHSWGIAIDFDPENNQLKWGRDKARFGKPEYDYWWTCWEEEGWISLGRARNFDWMHVQAARLPQI